jgi:hypothetical protein
MRIFASAVAVVMALMLAEIGLRVVDVARPVELPPKPSRPEMFVADATVGYRLWPSCFCPAGATRNSTASGARLTASVRLIS